MRSTAVRPDVQPQALEIGQELLFRAAVEDHQRLVGNASQRKEVVDVCVVDFSRKDKPDVDLFFLMIRRPQRSPLSPYRTFFRCPSRPGPGMALFEAFQM